jgi:hypothetical protein
MDRRTAENLLRGDRATPGAGHPLTGLLAAAKAPATAGELSGEAAALAAFRAAAHSPDPVPPRRRPMLAKLLTLKVAAAAFATTAAVGGVALAASTGALPGPISAGKPSHSATPAHSTRPAPSGSALPAPKVDELCREFKGKDRDHQTKALDDARFGELVKRAGEKNRDRVDRFCRLHQPEAGTTAGTPWPSTTPGLPWPGATAGVPEPGTKPSTRPSGRPRSTNPGTSLPSGFPKPSQGQQQS